MTTKSELRAEIQRLREQIERVETLHSNQDGSCAHCLGPPELGEVEPWPCPTIQWLRGGVYVRKTP